MFVKEAFDQVTQTEQAVSQMRNEAEGDAAQTLRRAQGEAQAIINQGMSRSNLITSRVIADAKVFGQLKPHYEANPSFFRSRLLIEGMGRILAQANDTWLLPQAGAGKTQELRLQLNREPTLTGGSSNEDDDFGNLFHNQGRISSFSQGVQLQTGPPSPRGLRRAGILGEQDEGRQRD